MPGGGSLGPLQGLMGGLSGGGMPGGGLPPGLNASGLNSPPPMPTLGTDFARGLAAGAGAAGGAVPPASPVAQAPAAPLAAPVGDTPAAAAPASATPPVSAPPQTPAAPAPAGGSTGMTPYGSVLPPGAAGAGAGLGGGVQPASSPPVAPPAGGAGAAGAAGVVPALARGQRRDPAVRRDTAASDLELARAAVAELAAAGCVADPSVEWAVAVGRGASGMPTLWVSTNEGACYVPAGVFVPKTMPLARGFDPDFDARWFGWMNPAETVVRAITARGETVSAVATTWALRSEELREAVREVATGVAPGEPGGPATEQTRARSHRLQTVDPAMFDDLQRAEEPTARQLCRELTQRAAFGGGEPLSAVAQSVARALVAGRWPSDAEWEALGAEYDLARLTAGSNRSGSNGVESADMLASYYRAFVAARRLETLLCWKQPGQLADVVYAAWTAGVRAAMHHLT